MHKDHKYQARDDKDSDTRVTSTSKQNDKSDMKLYVKDENMVKILNKKGITKLFPIQYETFDFIAKGEDVVAKDRTGSGKTLAFALPVITKMRLQSKFKGSHTNTKFLIVLPTRQLAIQVKEEIASLKYRDQEDFNVLAIYGGNGMQEQLDAVSRGADIIVATPGRLIDFLNRGVIKMDGLQTICLDQADQMLKIGFKQDIEKIFQFITKAKSSKVQCLLFSATIPQWIWQISDKYQSKTRKFIDMIKDNNIKTSKTVEHYCIKASPLDKQVYMASIIKHFLKGKSGKVIIFCETKRQVDRIGNGGLIPLSVQTLHGDVKQFQRQKVFRKFKSGQVQCLIATNVAARGLDFPQIDLIIQMQPPTTTDAYIHRSGRTGRAGKPGVCVTMYGYKQQSNMKRIEEQTKIILHHINSKDLIPSSSSNDQRGQGNSKYETRDRQHRGYDNKDRSSDRNYDRNERSSYNSRQPRNYNSKQKSYQKPDYNRSNNSSSYNGAKQQRKSNNNEENYDY